MSIVRTNDPKSHPFKYDVAFSFAEEDRAFVDRVVMQLKQEKIKLYYDDHERNKTWGKDLSVHLEEVYMTEARFCVMFISKYYKEKRWTKYETEHAQARAFFIKNKEYILPFRFDNTEIPGIKDSIIYLSRELYDERRLAKAIVDKVKQTKPPSSIFGKPTHVAIALLLMLTVIDISIYELSGKSTLTARLLQQLNLRNKWHFSAVCKDGTLSQRSGSGACSHHKGVDHKIDTVIYGEQLANNVNASIHTMKSGIQ